MSRHLNIKTVRGDLVQCTWWPSKSPQEGVIITAAGAGGGPGPGGSDGPYYLFKRLAEHLPTRFNISVLQIVYHAFSDMQAAVDDILAAIDWILTTAGASVKIALIGWSMGGAAVAEAAYLRGGNIKGIITIGGQTVGGENADKLHPETSFAILHGAADTCISPEAANHFYTIAGGPSKRNLLRKLFAGEDHGIKGAWDFLASGTDAYIRHLFAIPEATWNAKSENVAGTIRENVQTDENGSKVFYLLSNGRLITVPCNDFLNIRIGDIKQWFGSHYHMRSEAQEYIFNGVTLQNNLTLNDAGVKPESTIRLQNK